VVENNLLELLVHLFLFAEDDITLALDGLGLELGVLEDIREDVDGGGDIVVEGLGVVDGVLALLLYQYPAKSHFSCMTYRGVGIEVSAHVFYLELQLLLCALLGSLCHASAFCPGSAPVPLS
jgi:hypothetical protein